MTWFTISRRFIRAMFAATLVSAFVAHALAQDSPEELPTPAQIEVTTTEVADADIRQRIEDIFSEVESLQQITVAVNAGVVTLSGQASTTDAITRAESIASRLTGVVTVESEIERTLDVQTNVSPLLKNIQTRIQTTIHGLPVLGLAAVIFGLIVFLGHLLARWKSLWRKLLPNPFLAELVAQAVRAISIVLALVVSLNLLGATTLMGTILGGAGVVGLAIGFAIRDTLENYFSSIMLSLRQPFRVNEHVVIGEHQGKVVRLTSRSTILMTHDGNHLRIPNATVFKSPILNYSTNPERRFSFELGIDSQDDPIAAMQLGLNTLEGLPFILTTPSPETIIVEVGDSSIKLRFLGWVDQRETNYGKARGLALSATKTALESAGFSLPEPIYRVKLDSGVDIESLASSEAKPSEQKLVAPDITTDDAIDVTPDTYIDEKVSEERANSDETDLLDHNRPVE